MVNGRMRSYLYFCSRIASFAWSAAIRGGRARRGMRREYRWLLVGRRSEALLRQSGKAARDLCLERSLAVVAGLIAAGYEGDGCCSYGWPIYMDVSNKQLDIYSCDGDRVANPLQNGIVG